MSFKTYNHFVVEGYISSEPELRRTAEGKAVCNFAVAFDSGSEKDPRTTFLDVTSWGKQAEFVFENMSKGTGVFVDGKLDTDRWIDRATDNKRSKIFVNAKLVRFPTGRGNNTKDTVAASAGPTANNSWNDNSDMNEIDF